MRKKTGEVFRDLEDRDEGWEKNEWMQRSQKESLRKTGFVFRETFLPPLDSMGGVQTRYGHTRAMGFGAGCCHFGLLF